MPVAQFVLNLLRHRQEENRELFGNDHGWVFPATARRNGHLVVTHVVEVKEQVYYRDEEGRQRKRAHPVVKSAHRLRDTFASVAIEAEVDWFFLKVLMNHRLPNSDVTGGYVRPMSLDGLRTAAEKVAALLLERAGRERYALPPCARNSAG